MIFKKEIISKQLSNLEIEYYYQLLDFSSKLMNSKNFKDIKNCINNINWKYDNNIISLKLNVLDDIKNCPNFGVINGKTIKISESEYDIFFEFRIDDIVEISNKIKLLDIVKKFKL